MFGSWAAETPGAETPLSPAHSYLKHIPHFTSKTCCTGKEISFKAISFKEISLTDKGWSVNCEIWLRILIWTGRAWTRTTPFWILHDFPLVLLLEQVIIYLSSCKFKTSSHFPFVQSNLWGFLCRFVQTQHLQDLPCLLDSSAIFRNCCPVQSNRIQYLIYSTHLILAL